MLGTFAIVPAVASCLDVGFLIFKFKEFLDAAIILTSPSASIFAPSFTVTEESVLLPR